MSHIPRDEWLKALGDAVQDCDASALTVVEIAQEFGINRQAAYRKVLELIAEGRAVATRKIVQTRNGARRIQAYRLVSPKKK